MMIKLENGDYVNTHYIERLWMVNEHDGFISLANAPDVPITKNDSALIVKAMKPKIMPTLGKYGELGPTIYREGRIDYGAMAFSHYLMTKR